MRTTKRPDTPDWDVIGKGSVHVYPISRTEMSDARPRTGLDLSLVQVVAGTGAALTAALLGSLFGIAGTLTGTAVGSTVGTVCTAVYTHQLRRTRDRLHHSVRAPMGWWRLTSLRSVPWLRVLAGAAVVFGVALIALTVLEASLGPPCRRPTRGVTGAGR